MMMFSNNNGDVYTIRLTDVKDGLSNTVMVGEVTESQNVSPTNRGDGAFPTWAGGNNDGDCGQGLKHGGNTFRIMDPATGFVLNLRTTDTSDACFGSQHPGGANFVMGDGTVRFVQDSVDPVVYSAIASRNGRETAQLP
jgi:prepilin-type processing-associated H-X9-DG protein